MKRLLSILAILTLLTPVSSFALGMVTTERVQFSIEESGDWSLTDIEAGISWQGEWVTSNLMKVTGSDNSCFLLTENNGIMVSLDCKDLTTISIFLSLQ